MSGKDYGELMFGSSQIKMYLMNLNNPVYPNILQYEKKNIQEIQSWIERISYENEWNVDGLRTKNSGF